MQKVNKKDLESVYGGNMYHVDELPKEEDYKNLSTEDVYVTDTQMLRWKPRIGWFVADLYTAL